MTNAKIPKIGAVPKHIERVKASINPIVEIVNKGIVVNTSSVIARKLPDGRVQLFLHPDITSRFQ